MDNLKTFNKKIAKLGLELVKAKDYFYWIGVNNDIHDKIINCSQETGVYVFRFSHLSNEQWINEVETILEKINTK
jgi:hypothetical protein